MAATPNTAVSLSETYFLRSFYKNNRDAANNSKRKELSTNTLSQADSEALRAGVRKLRNFDYKEETDDKENIYSSVSAFIKTYNNALDSSNSSKDYSLKRYAKQLKALAKDHAEELSDIGITVKSDGTLEKSEVLLKNAKPSKIDKLFGKDATFVTKSARYAKKMEAIASGLIYTELTQAGSHINLTL